METWRSNTALGLETGAIKEPRSRVSPWRKEPRAGLRNPAYTFVAYLGSPRLKEGGSQGATPTRDLNGNLTVKDFARSHEQAGLKQKNRDMNKNFINPKIQGILGENCVKFLRNTFIEW